MKKQLCALWASLLMFPLFLSAQAPATFTFDGVNNIQMQAATNGRLFWNGTDGQFSLDSDGISMMQMAGLWIAGVDPSGALKGAIQLFDEGGNTDFQSGMLDPATMEVIGADQYWEVTATEIEAHLADFAEDGVIDNPIAAIYGWPGRSNPFFSNYNDFDLPGTSQGFAPFWDNNGNGQYNPDEGDFPIIEVRGCDGFPMFADKMLWFAFNDKGTHASGMGNIDFEVHTMLFAFGCEGQQALENTVYAQYKLINRGTESIDSAFVGMAMDFSIGCPQDDYLGTNGDWNVIYGYNSTETDEACGEFSGLGAAPSVSITKLIRGPLNEHGNELDLHSVMPLFFDGTSLPAGMQAPTTPSEYFRLLTGKWRDGTPLTVGGDGYQTEGEETFLAYPDLPSESGGWSERVEGVEAGRRGALASYGPFRLDPGAVNEFLASFTIANNPNATTVDEQIDQAFDNIAIVQYLFDVCFDASADVGCMTTSTHEQIALNEKLSVFPNPAVEEVMISIEDSPIVQLRLLTIDGKLVLSKNGQLQKQMQLSIGHLPKGVYLLQVQNTDGAWANQKLIITP